MVVIQKNLGITLVVNTTWASTLACPCRDAKHLAKASEVQILPGLWQGLNALYRREKRPSLCCHLSTGTDASQVSLAPAAPGLVAPFLKVTGEVRGGTRIDLGIS